MRPGFYDRYGYADYAWVALDAGAIEPALENLDRFREAGVGLLAIAEGGVVVEHLDAEYRPRRRYTRDRAWVESEVWARLDDAEVETQTDARSNTSAPNQQRLDALGGRMTEAHGLRDAYDQLEHEVVECSPSLSVPVSTPAQFAYADTPGVTDAEAIADRIADSPIAFLDVSTTNGDAWYEFTSPARPTTTTTAAGVRPRSRRSA